MNDRKRLFKNQNDNKQQIDETRETKYFQFNIKLKLKQETEKKKAFKSKPMLRALSLLLAAVHSNTKNT